MQSESPSDRTPTPSGVLPPAGLLVRLGCEFCFETAAGAEFVVLVEPHAHVGRVLCLGSNRSVEPTLPMRDYVDAAGNLRWRITADGLKLAIRYDATFAVPGVADEVNASALQDPVSALPDGVLVYTLPSRYCQSDLLMDEAWRLFGAVAPGYQRAQAICDWVHANVKYAADGADPAVSAVDTYARRRGVCRDFAHLATAFCRALNIPARYSFGYLPDYLVAPPDVPMDFHAWCEAYLEGRWYVFDARHNVSRIGRVKIAHGRDAVDVAMITSFGWAQLQAMSVWAEVRPDAG